MNQPFRIVGTTQLLASTVFSVERRTVGFGDTTFERDVVIHKGAVAIVAVNDLDQVAFISQYRAPFDCVNLEIPAGTLDVDGEDPLRAAQRELLEEIGCEALQWNELGRFMVSPGWTDQVMTIYEARSLTILQRRPEGPEEFASRVTWLGIDAIREHFGRGALVDATAVLGLERVFGNLRGVH